jgi:putative ABC transport system substrate-binding protein
MIGRRELITLLGGAAWSSAAVAQPAGKLPTIGFLGTSSTAVWSNWTDAFVQRLRELGWIEGRTATIEYRWGEGSSERFAVIAAELSRMKVDVIVTAGSAVPAVKKATSVIPVVFVIATDPVGEGLVANLSRPGGNVTGLSNQGVDLASKRLELLREVVPGLRRIAILANAGYSASVMELGEVQSTDRRLGLDVASMEVRRTEDIATAFEALKGRADALYVVADGLVTTNRARILTFATGARLPTIMNAREHTAAGAVMSYGPSFRDLFRRSAEYVDKILRGAKPSDLPIEQPTKFELVVNLITAKAIGLEVPPMLLARADEVIE